MESNLDLAQIYGLTIGLGRLADMNLKVERFMQDKNSSFYTLTNKNYTTTLEFSQENSTLVNDSALALAKDKLAGLLSHIKKTNVGSDTDSLISTTMELLNTFSSKAKTDSKYKNRLIKYHRYLMPIIESLNVINNEASAYCIARTLLSDTAEGNQPKNEEELQKFLDFFSYLPINSNTEFLSSSEGEWCYCPNLKTPDDSIAKKQNLAIVSSFLCKNLSTLLVRYKNFDNTLTLSFVKNGKDESDDNIHCVNLHDRNFKFDGLKEVLDTSITSPLTTDQKLYEVVSSAYLNSHIKPFNKMTEKQKYPHVKRYLSSLALKQDEIEQLNFGSNQNLVLSALFSLCLVDGMKVGVPFVDKTIDYINKIHLNLKFSDLTKILLENFDNIYTAVEKSPIKTMRMLNDLNDFLTANTKNGILNIDGASNDTEDSDTDDFSM